MFQQVWNLVRLGKTRSKVVFIFFIFHIIEIIFTYRHCCVVSRVKEYIIDERADDDSTKTKSSSTAEFRPKHLKQVVAVLRAIWVEGCCCCWYWKTWQFFSIVFLRRHICKKTLAWNLGGVNLSACASSSSSSVLSVKQLTSNSRRANQEKLWKWEQNVNFVLRLGPHVVCRSKKLSRLHPTISSEVIEPSRGTCRIRPRKSRIDLEGTPPSSRFAAFWNSMAWQFFSVWSEQDGANHCRDRDNRFWMSPVQIDQRSLCRVESSDNWKKRNRHKVT
jgi:hypothetical protein